MRQATKEYPFDWMLWRSFEAASKIADGTEKEYAQALNCIPYFRGIAETMFGLGEPGKCFIRCCSRYFENILKARETGRKKAITTFCFSPTILYAFDVIPICLEVLTVVMTMSYKRGTAEFLDYCNEVGFTETSCSSQRGSLGAYLAGIGQEIDMVVTDTPGVCDTNANAFAFAAAYLKKPFFQLDFPPTLAGDRSDKYHREDYKALIRFLEEQTGKRLDPDRLRAVLEEVRTQDGIVAELEELTRIVPCPLPVPFNFLMYAGRFLFGGMKECTELLRSMLKVAKSNVENGVSGLSCGRERARAFFCYIDHYTQSMRFWQMLEELGVGYSGNILSKHWAADAPNTKWTGRREAGYEIRTGGVDELIDSVADLNSRMPMVKSIRGPYDAPDMWLEESIALAKMYGAQCIVYNGTPGCRNTWGMLKLFARDTEKAGFPTHIMYADAFDDRVQSWESTRERFEEFLNVRRLLK